ncbi:MAG: TolB-like 6-bladed beta-propeller domain-containing protein [Tannerella sp.]|jgi:hypothetical protein|nr:TolB-like 6-bladed beta-propeller domain-containing protein [Tannerella sp.]
MKTKKKKLFAVYVIPETFVFLFSCKDTIREDTLFARKKAIVFKEMSTSEPVGQVLYMKSMGDYLVVTGKNLETQAQLIDRKTKKSFLFGETGDGPGRFLQSANIMSIDDRYAGIFDMQRRTVFKFNVDSIIQQGKLCRPETLVKEIPSFIPMGLDRLGDDRYVALGIMSDLKRFVLLDGKGEIVSMEGQLPEKKQERISDFVHAFAYWGRFTASPKEHKIAVCTNYAGMIQIYDCKTDGVRLIREHNLFSAEYNEREGNFVPTPQTRWGYLSIDSSDKYIFALYSGLNQVDHPDGAFTSGNIIHVFDWNGNPVCRLSADRRLKVICADNDLNLYGYDGDTGELVVADIKEAVE